jgi:hypothetical protein
MSDEAEERTTADEPARTPDPSFASRAWSLIQQHVPLVVSGLLAMIVALDVGLASGFDVSIARALVNSGGSVQVLMGIALSLLPVVLFAIATFGAVTGGRALRKAIVAKDWESVLMISLVGGLFLLWAMILLPWWGLIFVVASLLLALLLPWKQTKSDYRLTLYIFAAALVSFLLTIPGVWLPAEVIGIDGQERVLGYLLQDDGQWATILIDEPREILVVPSAKLRSRRVCTKQEDDYSPPS